MPCNGSCIGKARVTVAGGIPPYTVRWPSGQTDQITTVNGSNTATVSDSIFSTYLIPFEVVSVLLLAALVGAIVLARKD